jgi:importin-4
MFNIRGRGLECLGHIAVAIGAEHFTPYHQMGLQAALQGIQIGEDSLKEYAYTYVANVAKVMKNAFDSQLETLVPHLLEVVSESELNPYVGEADALDGLIDDDEEGAEDGVIDEDDDNEQYHLTTHEGFVNSKKAALCAIGSLADHTGASFYPYLEKTLNTLLHEQTGALWSFHRLIRAEALVTLQYLVKVACMQFGPVTPPNKGEIIEMHPVVRECVIATTTTCINAMVTDVEKLPAAFSIESLESILKSVGMAAMTIMDVETEKSYGDLIMQNILTLLKEKGKSQTVMKREHHDNDEDDDDHDNLVMDAVCDLIATLAKVIGEGYLPFFEPMVKYLVKFTKKNRPHSDRAMAIGCFGEVINEVGQIAGDKFADMLLPILRDGVADSMESVRRNASYALGVLCQRSPVKMSASCLQVLQWLYPLCIRSTDVVLTDVGGADSDNALGAVARMIMNCEGVPLAQVIPVLLNAMPIRSDFGEGQTVYDCITWLLRRDEETIYSLIPQVLVLLTDVLKDDSRYNDLTKVCVIQTIKFLGSEKHDVMVAAMGHVPADQQPTVIGIVERAMQS